MAGRGGYQPPAHPAPVSGPGALSGRTDGGPADSQPVRRLPDAKYGESKDFEGIQAGAPMGGGNAPEQPIRDRSQLIPFEADTARPDEPVTAGADAGAGPGSEMLGIPSEEQADIQHILPYLPALEFAANRPNASPSMRAMIRRIKAKL